MIAKTEKEQKVQYLLRNVSFRSASGVEHAQKVILYADDDSIPIGSRIRSTGPVSGFSTSRNEGNFDFAAYYKSQKILFQQFSEQIGIVTKPHISLRELLYRFRKQMRSGIRAAANEEDAGILCAMLLGDRGLLDDSTRQMYQRNGISHIMAISGLHISIFGMSLFRLLKSRLNMPFAVSCIVSGGAVALFVLMSGQSPSAMRAMIMFYFYLGSKWSGRSYDSLTALGYSAVFLLLCNPLAVMQTGFLLSYTAVLSIGIVLPALEIIAPVPACFGRLAVGRRAWSSAQLSLSVWIGLAPLSAALFYYISPYSVLLNLIVIPCCSLLLADGLISGLAGIRMPVLAQRLCFPDHCILRLFSLQMHGAGKLPGHNVITGHIPAWELLTFYVLLFVCCMLIRRKRRAILARSFPGEQTSPARRQWIRRCRIMFLAPVLALIVLCAHPQAASFRVDFLDVGQGDGICITSGEGMHVMIDGGSTSEKQVGSSRIRPFLEYHRIRKVDLWIVTHTDEDHVSGLLELLESGYPVTSLVFSEASVNLELAAQAEEDALSASDADHMMERLVRAAKKNHTSVQKVSAGATIRDGDIRMTCLYPGEQEAETDKNELSMVWRLEHNGRTFLLTGDLGEAGEERLSERGLLSDTDVLKVGHHGSNYSSSELFLRQTTPEFAVISVGEGNRYHHPGKDALKRLMDCGADIRTTMDAGQITYYEKHGQMYLKSFCEKAGFPP